MLNRNHRVSTGGLLVIVAGRDDHCVVCTERVEALKGFAFRVAGRWSAICNSTECLRRCDAHGVSGAALQIAEASMAGSDRPAARVEADMSAHFPYNPSAVSAIRKAPSARFDGDRKCWQLSRSDGALADSLSAALDAGLSIHASVVEAARAAGAQRSAYVDAVEARAIAAGAYGFQVTGVREMAKRIESVGGVLQGDDMGLGKTFQALMCLEPGGRAIVVCPASLKINWLKECRRFRPDLSPRVISGRQDTVPSLSEGEVAIMNYSILPASAGSSFSDSEQSALHGVTLITDECQAVKNKKSARHKKIRNMADYCARVIALTGTPLDNAPFDLYGVLEAHGLRSECFSSFRAFTDAFGGEKDQWGGWHFSGPSADVPKRLARVTIRRTKREVAPELPGKVYQDVSVAISDQLRAKCYSVMSVAERLLSTGRLPTFTEWSETRAALAKEKTSAAVALVESYEDAGIPLVVFSSYLHPVDLLGAREGWAKITGSTSAADRDAAVVAFQAGKLKGIAGTVRAAGTGLTLTRADTMVFVDLDLNPSINDQAEDRINRIGATAEHTTYIRLVADHPMDERITELLHSKKTIRDAAILPNSQIEETPLSAVIARIDAGGHAWVEDDSGYQGDPLLVDESPADWDAREAARVQAEAEKKARKAALKSARKTRESFAKWSTRARARAKQATPKRLNLTEDLHSEIYCAMEHMLGVCDGALTKDGVGFNKPDASIASHLNAFLHRGEIAETSFWMLRRYRGQLEGSFPDLFDASALRDATPEEMDDLDNTDLSGLEADLEE